MLRCCRHSFEQRKLAVADRGCSGGIVELVHKEIVCELLWRRIRLGIPRQLLSDQVIVTHSSRRGSAAD